MSSSQTHAQDSAFIAEQIKRIFFSETLDGLEKLDQLLPLLQLPGRQAVLRSNLKNIFEDAHLDKLNLLDPPPIPEFHLWLQKPLQRIRDEEGVAKPNTFNTRATTLSRMYARLYELGLLKNEPLRGLTRAPSERQEDPLLSRNQLNHLHASTTNTYTLAALLLIDELAFTMTDLLELRWDHIQLNKELLLRRTESRIPTKSLRALETLAQEVGAPLFPQTERVFPYTEAQLRVKIWQAFGNADLAFVPPSRLRQAGLRDHGSLETSKLNNHAQNAGFIDIRAYAEAVRVAQALEKIK